MLKCAICKKENPNAFTLLSGDRGAMGAVVHRECFEGWWKENFSIAEYLKRRKIGRTVDFTSSCPLRENCNGYFELEEAETDEEEMSFLPSCQYVSECRKDWKGDEKR